MQFRVATRREGGSGFPAAFAAGAAICLVVVATIVLMSRHASVPQRAAQSAKFPFGPTEQAYAPNIHFTNIKLATAENFLGEQFTYVQLTVTNAGTRTVNGLSVELEFFDPFKQVVLKDTEQLIGTNDPRPLRPTEQRGLQITLGALPAEWNHEVPVFHVTGLVVK
jgi:hypothetical protein